MIVRMSRTGVCDGRRLRACVGVDDGEVEAFSELTWGYRRRGKAGSRVETYSPRYRQAIAIANVEKE